MAKIQPDYSTINLSELKKLPTYTLPPSYHLSGGLGQGCAGDPPGYPSHFLQAVYTRYGNSPARGPKTVIKVGGILYVVASTADWRPGYKWEDVYALRAKQLRSLWRPLPLDHERSQIWIKHTYAHFGHSYTDPTGEFSLSKYGGDSFVHWPVDKFWWPANPRKATFGYKGDRSPITFKDLAPGVQKAELTVYRARLKDMLARAWNVVKDKNNHKAVQAIRRFYPEHTPNLEYIARPPRTFQTEWIDIYDHQPAPDECPGHLDTPHGKFDNCRMCGRQDIGPMERARTGGR